MPYPYNTQEYKHLLLAERAIAHEIENPTEDSNLSTLAQGLVRVIDSKQAMRGIGKPKPVEGRATAKRRRTAAEPFAPLPAPAPTPEPPKGQ